MSAIIPTLLPSPRPSRPFCANGTPKLSSSALVAPPRPSHMRWGPWALRPHSSLAHPNPIQVLSPTRRLPSVPQPIFLSSMQPRWACHAWLDCRRGRIPTCSPHAISATTSSTIHPPRPSSSRLLRQVPQSATALPCFTLRPSLAGSFGRHPARNSPKTIKPLAIQRRQM